MKNIKLYEKLKEVKGKKVALIAGSILTGALVVAGCSTEVVVDPNTGNVTVTEQQPTEPEVIETSDPVEEVVEEKPVEEVVEDNQKYALPTKETEPKFDRVIYTTEDVVALVSELEKKYLTDDYPNMTQEEIVALVNELNGCDYATGTFEELVDVYGFDVYGASQRNRADVTLSDFILNPQVKEYDEVIHKAIVEDYDQFVSYLKSEDIEYDYNFIYNASSEQMACTSFDNVLYVEWQVSNMTVTTDKIRDVVDEYNVGGVDNIDIVYGHNYDWEYFDNEESIKEYAK